MMKPLLTVICSCCLATAATAGDQTITLRPADTGAELANPGMGWGFYYYDNEPRNYGSKLASSDTPDDWPGLTVIYLRIPWSYLEPEEGKLDWSILDTPAQRWISPQMMAATILVFCSIAVAGPKSPLDDAVAI
jgi:hypothetical protein